MDRSKLDLSKLILLEAIRRYKIALEENKQKQTERERERKKEVRKISTCIKKVVKN